ncbi:hypothetical protein [Paramicrobacterium agarici]|uniref:LysM domain-containing protein n=1 Tax=Paramicrobacterium agarici TaxID=630514 RepID=A0A2A9DXI0_9MICO|nr:hypothetical protein [Microbacterium agarici]PFG31051.1 hypothetical protein ATJ78_1996 [Microbacterium agarici]
MSTQQTDATVRLRLTRRGRAVVTALASLPLVLGVGYGAMHAASAAATNDESSSTFEYVTVTSGESLWMLAERIAPEHDPREVVAEIVDLNQLGTSSVSSGERIAIPSQYEVEAQ